MKSIVTIIVSFLFCIQLMQANVIIINGLTHSFSGVSGQTFEGQVILANTSNQEQRVTFELNEALYNCEEGRTFVKDFEHENSSTSWFKGTLNDVVLGPKERYTYKYNIIVPNDQTLNGSYWTTLMVNVEKPIKEEVVANIGLDTKIRYAIRLLTDVNIKKEVEIDFKGMSMKTNPVNYKKQLDVKILNESIFIENVKVSLEVYDVYGNKVLETITKRSKVFPEVCRDFSVDVSNLTKGQYQCLVIADSRDEYVGTSINLVIE